MKVEIVHHVRLENTKKKMELALNVNLVLMVKLQHNLPQHLLIYVSGFSDLQKSQNVYSLFVQFKGYPNSNHTFYL